MDGDDFKYHACIVCCLLLGFSPLRRAVCIRHFRAAPVTRNMNIASCTWERCSANVRAQSPSARTLKYRNLIGSVAEKKE